MEIGGKIKALRQKNQLTQEELANRCELTKGYISQLENDLTSPSIASLIDILNALGTTPGEFFAEEGDEQLVFSGEDYIVKENETYSITWLVPSSQKNMMEPVLVSLPAGGSMGKDLPHEGEEFGYVLEGRVKVTVGRKTAFAAAGESFYFRADRPHTVQNASKTEDARLLWLSTPPNF